MATILEKFRQFSSGKFVARDFSFLNRGIHSVSRFQIKMSGGDESNMPKFTGISKVFNSYTSRGRVNTVLATYAGCVVLYLYFKLKPKPEGPKN